MIHLFFGVDECGCCLGMVLLFWWGGGSSLSIVPSMVTYLVSEWIFSLPSEITCHLGRRLNNSTHRETLSHNNNEENLRHPTHPLIIPFADSTADYQIQGNPSYRPSLRGSTRESYIQAFSSLLSSDLHLETSPYLTQQSPSTFDHTSKNGLKPYETYCEGTRRHSKWQRKSCLLSKHKRWPQYSERQLWWSTRNCLWRRNIHVNFIIPILPPSDTYYSPRISIKIPDNYPFRPPVMKFETKLWHPNVSSQTVCILEV